jgi:hypothetical protein
MFFGGIGAGRGARILITSPFRTDSCTVPCTTTVFFGFGFIRMAS